MHVRVVATQQVLKHVSFLRSLEWDFSQVPYLTFLAWFVREEALTFHSHLIWIGPFSLAVFIQDICGNAAEYSNTSPWPLSINSLSHNECSEFRSLAIFNKELIAK